MSELDKEMKEYLFELLNLWNRVYRFDFKRCPNCGSQANWELKQNHTCTLCGYNIKKFNKLMKHLKSDNCVL